MHCGSLAATGACLEHNSDRNADYVYRRDYKSRCAVHIFTDLSLSLSSMVMDVILIDLP
nr:hypothetical protein [Rhodococcus qingshengii]